jgi:hypothetical protein
VDQAVLLPQGFCNLAMHEAVRGLLFEILIKVQHEFVTDRWFYAKSKTPLPEFMGKDSPLLRK